MEIDEKIEISVASREMRLPKGFVLGAYNDKDSHRVCFIVDRYFNQIDLSEYAIYVMSANAFGDDDQFMVTEIEVTENKIEFVWIVQKLMFILAGDVTFSVCFRKVDNESRIISEYNTGVAVAEVVRDIVATGGVIEDVEKDIVIQIIGYRNEARQYALDANQAKIGAQDARDAAESHMNNAQLSARTSQSYATGDAVDDNGDPFRSGQDTDNAKYYSEQASDSADDSKDYARKAQSYATGDAEDDNGQAYRQGQATDNAQYYSGLAATHNANSLTHEQMAKSWAVGTGVDSNNQPIRQGQDTDNAKHYSEQASDSADDSLYNQRMAESYATGTSVDDNGDPFRSGQDTDNAKYYSEQASDSADDAKDSSEDAEAWAVGKRNNTNVESTDPAYNNNSKFWSDEAAHKVGLVMTEWAGTWNEWIALTSEEQEEYDFVDITDDWEEIGEFVGATESTNGERGLIPAPRAGLRGRGLRADGRWGLVESNIFVGTQSRWDDLTNAEQLEYKLALILDPTELQTIGGEQP